MRVFSRLTAILSLVVFPLATAADIREGTATVSITITNNGVRELPPENQTILRVFVHEELPSHNTPLPACQPTQNDAVETYALTEWHLPTGGMTYGVSTRFTPSDIRDSAAAAIEQGEETWTAVDGDKQLVFGGETFTNRPRYDGQNVIMWRGLSRGTIAVAYIWYDPAQGEVLDADMVFNTRVKWSTNDPAAGDCGGAPNTYDVQAIATHEFGHWLGLDDLYDPADIDLTMYGYATHTELKKATLGTGDTLGATAVAP